MNGKNKIKNYIKKNTKRCIVFAVICCIILGSSITAYAVLNSTYEPLEPQFKYGNITINSVLDGRLKDSINAAKDTVLLMADVRYVDVFDAEGSGGETGTSAEDNLKEQITIYEWQESQDGGVTWTTKLMDTSSSEYSTSLANKPDWKYRCVVTKCYNISDLVENAYRTFLGRASDYTGYTGWFNILYMHQLPNSVNVNGESITIGNEAAGLAFCLIDSYEFYKQLKLCVDGFTYGQTVDVGSISYAVKNNVQVSDAIIAKYIKACYLFFLNRTPADSEITMWTNWWHSNGGDNYGWAQFDTPWGGSGSGCERIVAKQYAGFYKILFMIGNSDEAAGQNKILMTHYPFNASTGKFTYDTDNKGRNQITVGPYSVPTYWVNYKDVNGDISGYIDVDSDSPYHVFRTISARKSMGTSVSFNDVSSYSIAGYHLDSTDSATTVRDGDLTLYRYHLPNTFTITYNKGLTNN